MDPFTIALATFGIQKLRGKSTNRALRDAALAGGIGQVAGMSGMVPGVQAFGQTALPGVTARPEMFVGEAGATIPQQFATSAGGIRNLANTGYDKFQGLSTGAKIGLGLGATTLLEGEPDDPEMPAGTRPEDYAAAKEKADKQIENILSSYDYEGEAAGVSPYSYQQGNTLFTFNKGGIAEVRKFNSGGINYLPSKTDHDEKDVNNYVRAMGYVEDGAGNGDKDEDTMLAQLADGEFVSRADAILGAGIMEGANPKSFKDMRKKGAAFFYGQQAKFKRIFDLLDEARKEAN
jgi:hypothetical protein